MRFFATLLLLSICLVESSAATAWADGGAVRLVESQGGLRISAFTAPNPLRAGPIDVSLLIQDAETGETIPSATATLTLTCRDAPDLVLHARPTTAAATNKLLLAALVELPQAGWWDIEIDCAAAGRSAQTRFAMEAGLPLPDWLTVWPWFAWPAGVVAIFAAHRLLASRHRARQVARACQAADAGKSLDERLERPERTAAAVARRPH